MEQDKPEIKILKTLKNILKNNFLVVIRLIELCVNYISIKQDQKKRNAEKRIKSRTRK